MDATSDVTTGNDFSPGSERGRGLGRGGRREAASFAHVHRSRGERKRHRSTITVDTRFYADGTSVAVASQVDDACEMAADGTVGLVSKESDNTCSPAMVNSNQEDTVCGATVAKDHTNTHGRIAGKDEPTEAVGAVPVPANRKEVKASSDFALLRRALTDAASVAQYVRTHEGKQFSQAKAIMTFLQAISNRSHALYAEWMCSYKAEVVRVLDRLYAHISIGKAQLTPYAHEFILRCEANGVRKTSWANSLHDTEAHLPTSGGGGEQDSERGFALAASPLLSPRELLTKLAEIDPVGRMQRRVEMITGVPEVARCAVKMSNCFTRAMHAAEEEQREHEGENESGVNSTVFTYATQSQLVSKLISKLRRLCGDACGPGVCDDAEVEGANDATPEDPIADDVSPAPARHHSATKKDAATADEASRMACREAVHSVLDVVGVVIVNRPASVTQQPIAKCVHLATWCAARGMIDERDMARVDELKTQANVDIQKLATQLETVMELKTVSTNDGGATLRARVQGMWEAGNQEYLFPHSVDVLSAIATAASAPGVEEKVRDQIAGWFVQTQIRLREKGVQLPRRALRLVQSVRDAKKQAAIAQQLSRERQYAG